MCFQCPLISLGPKRLAIQISFDGKLNQGLYTYYSTPVTHAPVHDGNCITWRSQDGAFAIYRDGIFVGSGAAAEGVEIPSGGAWVLAQEQDTVGGGFDENQAFEGELTEVHIFDKVLSQEEIFEMKETCAQCIREGNVISWNEFRSGVHGDVQEVPATFC